MDPVTELAKMIDEGDVVGQPITPSFLKLLSLQFTLDEAELALKIGMTGGTLDDLSEKIDLHNILSFSVHGHAVGRGQILYFLNDHFLFNKAFIDRNDKF